MGQMQTLVNFETYFQMLWNTLSTAFKRKLVLLS